MNYTVRKPLVGDLRAIYALDASPNEVPFLLAERCILLDGKPIGKEGLDQLETAEFEILMAEINHQPKKP